MDTLTTLLQSLLGKPELPQRARIDLDTLDPEARKMVEPLLEMKRAFETARVRCAVIGRSGAGKSSLINAIAGEKIAEVGVTEQTMEAQEFLHGGITFVDLPGCGTKNWPRDSYVDRLGLHSYDCFVLVTSTRFYEDDAYLYRALAAEANRPVFVVRTKIDEAITAGARDNDLSPAEVAEKLRAEVLHNLADFDASIAAPTVYLTSAWKPTQFGLPALIGDISGSLGSIKQRRFDADAAAYSEAAIRAKRHVADQHVAIAAAAAFVNGFNPVPGLDVGADLAIFTGLGLDLTRIYGLTEKQINFARRIAAPQDVAFKAGAVTAARLATQFVTRDGVAMLLRHMGKRAAARYTLKYLPFVGQVIAGAIGSKMIFDFGGDLIAQSEEAARQILQGVASGL